MGRDVGAGAGEDGRGGARGVPEAVTDAAIEEGSPSREGEGMKEPRRIQRKRKKGWRMPDGAVYVGRPTKWGNPWQVGDWIDGQRVTHAIAAEWYRLNISPSSVS